VNSEPKIAAPNELPIVRKNVTPDVATPRSSKLDVFCTISTSTCMHDPIPAPRMRTEAPGRAALSGVGPLKLDCAANPRLDIA